VSGSSPLAHAIDGRCPRCGSKTLFDGFIRFASTCRACGLEFSRFNVGDGPAAFLILIIGALLTVAAIVTDLHFRPPYWLHLIWIPVGAGLTLFGLRLGKAAMLAQEYRHQAREGRLEK
jgi:uncharacterized protein (DUF983 family)